MKKALSLLLAVAMILTMTVVSVSAADDIKVTIDGKAVTFADVQPQIINDRTMVPMRAIFEALGATVEWDASTRTAKGVKGDITVAITIDKNEVVKNGVAKEIDVPAQIVDDRTLVPVRAISESFDCTVEWKADTRTVVITTAVATATPAPTPTPAPAIEVKAPTLGTDKGWLAYDHFEGLTQDTKSKNENFANSGWKSLTVLEGNFSSMNAVWSDTTPGIGMHIFGVRTQGGGTSGGMYREFPAVQVLKDVPAELDADPIVAEDDSTLVIEYDIKWGLDATAKTMQASIRAPYGVSSATPMSSFMHSASYQEGMPGWTTSVKNERDGVFEEAAETRTWYRIRQEIHVKKGAQYGQTLNFYVNGVLTLEDQNFMSTSTAKVGAIGVAQFQTTGWKTKWDGSVATGISIDNFSIYLGKNDALPANKGLLIKAVRDGAAKVKVAQANTGEAPGQYKPAVVSALVAAADDALEVFYDYEATQTAVDAAYDAYTKALTGLVANA